MSTQGWKWSLILYAGALLLLTAGGYETYRIWTAPTVPADEGLAFLPSTELTSSFTTERENHVVFEVFNQSGQPRHLFGVEGYCNSNGCVRPVTEFPIVIPAGATTTITVSVQPKQVGEYEGQISILTNSMGQEKVTLMVRGNTSK